MIYKENYTYPVSITLSKSDETITRELIINKFKEAIKEYYNIDHDVNFDDIKRSFYQNGKDSAVLDYRFSTGEVPDIKSSTYNTMLDMCQNWHMVEQIPFDIDAAIHRIINGETNYDDLSELQTVYIGMKYDEAREFKDNEWNVLKFILKNKLKNLFKNRKDGTYHEVQLVDFKLDKLSKFNMSKFEYVNRRVKKYGKTLTNFAQASSEWNKEFQILLNLDRTKHSMELRTDLALSGLEDDIV